MKVRLLILTLFVAVLCSCGVPSTTSYKIPATPVNQFSMNKSTYVANYKVFQTLNERFALAMAQGGNMVIAIRTSTDFDPFYDGMTITTNLVMVDTYTYETVPDENGRRSVKTVPLVIPRDDYIKLMIDNQDNK